MLKTSISSAIFGLLDASNLKETNNRPLFWAAFVPIPADRGAARRVAVARELPAVAGPHLERHRHRVADNHRERHTHLHRVHTRMAWYPLTDSTAASTPPPFTDTTLFESKPVFPDISTASPGSVAGNSTFRAMVSSVDPTNEVSVS